MQTVEDYSRKKFFSHKFTGLDLTKAKLRFSTFYNCNFDDANLTEADCEGSDFIGSTFRNTVCYRTNFKDARLAGTVFQPKDCFGATFTLQCNTFKGMRVSQQWWFCFLMFPTMMHPDKGREDIALVDQLVAMIGAERYNRLRALFAKRDI